MNDYSDSISFYDSGCNITTVNNKLHSDSPMLFNRNLDNDPCVVLDALGTESPVEAHGYLLNHRINLVSQFKHPLISVSQVNLNNNAFSLFTMDRCYAIKLSNKMKAMLNDMLLHADNHDLILLQGDQVNGMFELPMSECINNSTISKSNPHDVSYDATNSKCEMLTCCITNKSKQSKHTNDSL